MFKLFVQWCAVFYIADSDSEEERHQDPYGSDDLGTLETIASVTAADIRQAHAMGLTRNRVLVAAVGDITAAELGILVDRLATTLTVFLERFERWHNGSHQLHDN